MSNRIKSNRLSKSIAVIVWSFAAIYLAFEYPSIPETIAIHFDINGQPDGYGSKVWLIGIFLIGVITTAVMLFIPVPLKYINLPVGKSLLDNEKGRKDLSKMISFIGLLTCGILFSAFYFMIQTAIAGTTTDSSVFFLVIIILSILLLLIYIGYIMVKYRNGKI